MQVSNRQGNSCDTYLNFHTILSILVQQPLVFVRKVYKLLDLCLKNVSIKIIYRIYSTAHDSSWISLFLINEGHYPRPKTVTVVKENRSCVSPLVAKRGGISYVAASPTITIFTFPHRDSLRARFRRKAMLSQTEHINGQWRKSNL